MTTAFTDCLQIEEFCDLEEYLEDGIPHTKMILE